MRLDAWLELRGKSPAKFAGEIGVPPSTITRFLNGEQKRPHRRTRLLIIGGTGGEVTEDDILNHWEAVDA